MRIAAFAILGTAACMAACSSPPQLDVEAESAAAPSPAAAQTVGPPRVVSVDPPPGAEGVPPGPRVLSVTFDREMDRGSWAWMRESEETSPEMGESWFDESGRTHSVRATLEPGKRYVIWINSDEVGYFKDLAGASAEPFRWTFSTAGGEPTAVGPVSAHGSRPTGSGPTGSGPTGSGPTGSGSRAASDVAGSSSSTRGPAADFADVPRVVELDPPADATDVDPTLTELRVTFDRPMREGWSWVTEPGALFPETRGEASFEPGMTTNVLPVQLRPNTTYVVWLNSATYRHFADVDGRELAPVRWTFTTGPRPNDD